MKTYPLLFQYQDFLAGNGFIAAIAVSGRALIEIEGQDEIWISGVNPGGMATSGCDFEAASVAHRATFHNILEELAVGAKDFADFADKVKEFVAETSPEATRQWEDSRAAMRAQNIQKAEVAGREFRVDTKPAPEPECWVRFIDPQQAESAMNQGLDQERLAA